MAITSRKITTYAKNIVDLSDQPNKDGLTAAQLKAMFDGRTDEEVKVSINGIVDDLVAVTDGASGADQVGATKVGAGVAQTVQGVLEELNISTGALDAASVHKAGTETISGVKTFLASPVVPTPTTNFQASTKKYVDDTDAARKTYVDNADNLKVNIANIVNDVTTGGTTVPLSAEQGKTLKGQIGDLASLTTTQKANFVYALNEVDGHADTNATSIGTLASLTTTEKTNLVGATNELLSVIKDNKINWRTVATAAAEEYKTISGDPITLKTGTIIAVTFIHGNTFGSTVYLWQSGWEYSYPITGSNILNLLPMQTQLFMFSGASGGNVFYPISASKGSIGLPNVDNTSDIDKPISTAAATVMGDLEDLDTTEKGSLVGAINENNALISTNVPKISNMIYDGITPNREIWHTTRTSLLRGEQPLTYLDGNAANPSLSYYGHTSARLVSTNRSTSRVRLTQSMDLSQFSHLEIISHYSDLSKVYYSRVLFFTSSAATGAYAVASPHSVKTWVGGKSGYVRYIVDLKAITYLGGFIDASWSGINLIELNLSAETDVSVTWDVFAVYGIVSKPALSIDFDDGYSSVYEKAYPIMRKLGLYGNSNINTGSVDDAEGTRMKWSQLRELHENGWSINNHTHAHINLSTSLEADIRADLALSRGILKREGFHDGANYLVCPFGAVDYAKWDIYFDYCKYLRTTTLAGLNKNTLPQIFLEGARGNMATLYTGITNTTTVATLKGYIDELIAQKTFTNLCFHRVVEGIPASLEYNEADFAEVMAYIAAKRDAGELLVLTARDLMYQSKGNVSVDYNGKAYLNSVNEGLPYAINLEVTELEV